MIENTKTRWSIILVTFVMAALWTLPNFVEVDKESFLPNDKIVYGLDIQGGLHLVMGVDVKSVITEKVARLSRSLKDDMADQGVVLNSSQVNPENPSEVILAAQSPDAVLKYLEDNYPASLQVVAEEGNNIFVRYYDSRVREFKKQVVDQAIEVIRNRVDGIGVSEPVIAAQGDDRILVQLPGIENSSGAKELINRAARLEFQIVQTEVSGEEISNWVKEAEDKGQYALGRIDQVNGKTPREEGQENLTFLPYARYLKKLNEDLAGKLPENHKLVFEKAGSAVDLVAGRTPFLVGTTSDLTGDNLEDAFVRPDEFNRPEVIFRFSVEGRRKFAKLTEENVNTQMAIILDGVIQSAPNINEKIDSATARITLGSGRGYQETLNEANFIATALRAGALPAAMEQLEERTVGPTLGADSIAKGKVAGIIGGILVLIFMLIYYRALGIVADIALAFNILLILAILTSLGATLTLPGVAGIVLTVGMAVDANVIIFERIKEELRKGASLNGAVKDGFGHALSAIIDANITTAVVCIVLMYFGTGPVRGFAVTLICGIVTSMFTAIFVSRSVIELMIHNFGMKKLIKV
jgi:preprotein translocase subunit SecD